MICCSASLIHSYTDPQKLTGDLLVNSVSNIIALKEAQPSREFLLTDLYMAQQNALCGPNADIVHLLSGVFGFGFW